MYILGIHTGHDAAACLFQDHRLLAFCKEERVTRVKNDGGFFDLGCVDEVLTIAGIRRDEVDVLCATRMKFPQNLFRQTNAPLKMLRRKLVGRQRDISLFAQMLRKQDVEEALLDLPALRDRLGLRDDVRVYFSNHHYSHVLAAWFYSDWSGQALYLSCDGGGDNAQYSAYVPREDGLTPLFGGEETLHAPQNSAASVGLAYAFATELCGFQANRHEGKLTGLAAFGTPVAADRLREQWYFSELGEVQSHLDGAAALKRYLKECFIGLSREDMAASIQVFTENLVLEWVEILRERHPARYLGLAGGVFSNVRLNQKLAELPGIEEIFIFPAMGDEGLPVGACIDGLMREGLTPHRHRLANLYFGRPYTAGDLVERARKGNFRILEATDVPLETARLLDEGQVGAIFNGGMEMGPRALGARTILASPADHGVNQSINERLQRTEFMPFAPFVRDRDACDVFFIDRRNHYACRWMTITVDVKPEWRERIPAVVHVDGTARPQVIKRVDNPLYYDILSEFTERTGLPCVVNTSFNAHEEPIINTPAEALRALADNRVDFLVCESAIILPAV